ncbi:transposase [Bradyrhizobium sp. SZCCHNS3002]|uniref:transposase n=1 Tax=unclassified Bradyrhizobium TaxID=2631580 RepID=UPI00396573B9
MDIPRRLARRGPAVKLLISDSHEGIKASVAVVLSAIWQRGRIHSMRNVLAPAGKSGRLRILGAHCRGIPPERPQHPDGARH